MRKLLILSADFTGHGHKSIADSLVERLNAYPDIEVRVIDGFDLMTPVQRMLCEKTYGPITRMPGKAWEIQYKAGAVLKDTVKDAIRVMIRTGFERLLEEFRPDCIMSVHPMFVGAVLDLLDELGLRIPFLTHEADLIDIAPQWFDPRIVLALAPSREAYECSLSNGMRPEQLRQVGFPVRSRFAGLARPYETHDPMTVTVMSGSEGSGMLKRVVRELLEHTDMHVNVICGRNKALRVKLRKAFSKKYYGRLNAMGFVENIQEVMSGSDILILRASPNTVMEGIALNKPIVLFGQLAGQELHNPQMLESHGVAVYCPVVEKLTECIRSLTDHGAEGARRMIRCQQAYQPTDAAEETARFLNEFITTYE